MEKISLLNLMIFTKKQSANFVYGLDGRFRKLVCDDFLAALLEHSLTEMLIRSVKEKKGKPVKLSRSAYAVGCIVFETFIEARCGFSMNGHHVAQDFAKLFPEEMIIDYTVSHD